MKQLLRFSFLLLALLGTASSALAYDFNVDGIYYYITGDNTVVVTSSGSYTGSVTIPSSVTYDGKTYSVTAIGGYAFAYCSGLTSVTIPNSVTEICIYAFSGCSGLTSITIPNSVTDIDFFAFSGCGGLTSVTIPNSVTGIGFYAFYRCSGLTSIDIPNSVTGIGSSAFEGCYGLTSITIGNSVTHIGSSAFEGCFSLTSVTCLAVTPPTADSGCFDFSHSIYDPMTLYVPKQSVGDYQTADEWKNFTTIVGMDFIDAGDVDGDGTVSIADVTGLIDYLLSGTWN